LPIDYLPGNVTTAEAAARFNLEEAQLRRVLRDALGLAAHAPLVYLAPEFDEWVVMDELASLPDKCRVRAVADKAEADHAVLDAGGNGAADSTEVADASYS